MATPDLIAAMKATFDGLKAIDKDRLLRPNIGEESLLQAGFTDTYERIMRRATFAVEYGATVDNNVLASTRNIFETLRNTLDNQAKLPNPGYVSQKANFLQQVSGNLEQLNQYTPHFVAAAVEARGFLQDEGIRKEYHKTVEEIRAQAQESLRQVKEESSRTIEEARKLAQQIEDRARKTAAHISVEAAQEQFRLGQEDLDKNVQLWAALSIGSIVTFVVFAVYLANVHFEELPNWHVIYFAAVRITILTAVGAVATFCLRILRAQMHMSQHNQHRQRVANSMAAFVEAAVTPEQRDLILSQLVYAVVDFGSSGLIPKEEDVVYSPKMVIDAVSRSMPQTAQPHP